MTLAELQARLNRAAQLPASLWVAGLALAAGAALARAVVYLLPSTGGDVAAARALGIVSVSILAGHSKAAESRAYALALAASLAASVAVWVVWAAFAGRTAPPPTPPATRRAQRVTGLELGLAALLALALFARLWSANGPWNGPWALLSEEGEMLAWVDTVLRGGALSRDVFCLYGPLSVWAVAALFAVFGASLGLWRRWIFVLNAPATLAVYLLLRGLDRSRVTAAAGAVAIALSCAPAVPGMSWSLARVGLGLGAFAALTRALERGTAAWRIATGALLALALLFSQEVGVACALGAGSALLLAPAERARAFLWIGAGAALVLAPALAYLAFSDSLSATFQNLFLFPRTRLLGFGAYPFPRLDASAESLRAYLVPAALAVSGFATATKLLRGARDPRTLVEVALLAFGALLFSAALSRPDQTHLSFAAPPALVLLATLFEDAALALRSRSHRFAAAAGLALGVAALAPWLEVAGSNLPSFLPQAPPEDYRRLYLPRGGSALLPDAMASDLESILGAIEARTAPGEPVWVFPNEALVYFLADRPQPTRFPLALFAVTRAQREQLVADLERTRPRWAVVYRYAAEVDGISYPVAMPEVVAYLDATYELDGTFGTFALLRRKD